MTTTTTTNITLKAKLNAFGSQEPVIVETTDELSTASQVEEFVAPFITDLGLTEGDKFKAVIVEAGLRWNSREGLTYWFQVQHGKVVCLAWENYAAGWHGLADELETEEANSSVPTSSRVPTSDHTLPDYFVEDLVAAAVAGGFTLTLTRSEDIPGSHAEALVEPLPDNRRRKASRVCWLRPLHPDFTPWASDDRVGDNYLSDEFRYSVGCHELVAGVKPDNEDELARLVCDAYVEARNWVGQYREDGDLLGYTFGFGGWIDDEGKLFLDVVRLLPDDQLDLAFEIASKHNEICFFDFKTADTIDNPDYEAETSEIERAETASRQTAPIDNDRVVQGQVGLIGGSPSQRLAYQKEVSGWDAVTHPRLRAVGR